MNRLTLFWLLFACCRPCAAAPEESIELTKVAGGKVQLLEAAPEGGAARAVIVNDLPLAHTAQMLPLDADGKLAGQDDFKGQAKHTFENVAQALGTVGSSFDSIVKLNLYIADSKLAEQAELLVDATFQGEIRPAVSLVVTRLPHKGALLAVDAVALVDPKKAKAEVDERKRRFLPAAVLPAGERIYVSGQAEPGDLKAATRKTLESLRATLKFLGRTDADVVELKAFLTPIEGAEDVKQELAAFFGDRPVPPYSLVEWESTLPIEIELVAAGGKREGGEKAGTGSRVEYLTPPGMTASPVFSRLARVGPGQLIYVSGLYGGAGASGASQVEAIFQDLKETLELTGSDFNHLVKATYCVSKDDASRALNDLRPKYYDSKRPPAASKAVVRGVGQPGETITLDMIAVPAK